MRGPAPASFGTGRSEDRSVQVLTGRSALEELGPRLDDLHARTGCPVTARRPWLQSWVESYPEHEPLVVVVTAPDGGLRAAAPLAVGPGGLLAHVVPMGAGPSDEVRLPSLGVVDAELLAYGVVHALGQQRRPWLLLVRHLDPGDVAVGALSAALPWSRVTPGDVSPRLAFRPDRSLRMHVSRNHHQQVRRMRNRLARDGLSPQIAQLSRPDHVAEVWPEVERVCRARDQQLRGGSDLDDPHFGSFVRTVVPRLAARDEVRLTTLQLRGRLAAYVLSFQDGEVRRMWNCRLDPALQDYGVGRLANDAALEDALADRSCSSFDWMRGEESYKASMSDHVHRTLDLTAVSNRALWTAATAREAVRLRLGAVRDRGGRAGRLVSAVQPVLERLDRLR